MAVPRGSCLWWATWWFVIFHQAIFRCAATQSQGALLAGQNAISEIASLEDPADPVLGSSYIPTALGLAVESPFAIIKDPNGDLRKSFTEVNSTRLGSECETQLPTPVEARNRTRNAFSFKGIGINFVKSIIHWQTFGINLVIPITPNFPEYDSVLQYPRVNCYVGMYYPSTLSFTVSASVPSQVVAAAAQRAADYCRSYQKSEHRTLRESFTTDISVGGSMPASSDLLTNSTSSCISSTTATARPVQNNISNKNKNQLSVSDSVRRVGLRFSLRYDGEYGCRALVGPTVAYLPGAKVLELAKPVLLALPTLLAFVLSSVFDPIADGSAKVSQAVSYLHAVLALIRKACARVLRALSSRFGTDASTAKNPAARSASVGTKRKAAAVTAPATNRARSRRRRTYKERWSKTSTWLHSKTLGFAMNLGYFATSYDRIMGSNVIFELQPFFPLHKHLVGRSESAQYTYAARASSAASPQLAALEGESAASGTVESVVRRAKLFQEPGGPPAVQQELPDREFVSEPTTCIV